MATYLVVEAAFGVEVLEVLRVDLASPELHVRDLEVAPDYEAMSVRHNTYQNIGRPCVQ